MRTLIKCESVLGCFCLLLLLAGCSDKDLNAVPDTASMPPGFQLYDYYHPVAKINDKLYHFDGRALNYEDKDDPEWNLRPQSYYIDFPPKGFERYKELSFTADRENIQNDQIADYHEVPTITYVDTDRPDVIYCEMIRDQSVGPILFRFATDEMFGKGHIYVEGALYGRILQASAQDTKELQAEFVCLGQLEWTKDTDSLPDSELTTNRYEFDKFEVYSNENNHEIVYVKDTRDDSVFEFERIEK